MAVRGGVTAFLRLSRFFTKTMDTTNKGGQSPNRRESAVSHFYTVFYTFMISFYADLYT